MGEILDRFGKPVRAKSMEQAIADSTVLVWKSPAPEEIDLRVSVRADGVVVLAHPGIAFCMFPEFTLMLAAALQKAAAAILKAKQLAEEAARLAKDGNDGSGIEK